MSQRCKCVAYRPGTRQRLWRTLSLMGVSRPAVMTSWNVYFWATGSSCALWCWNTAMTKKNYLRRRCKSPLCEWHQYRGYKRHDLHILIRQAVRFKYKYRRGIKWTLDYKNPKRFKVFLSSPFHYLFIFSSVSFWNYKLSSLAFHEGRRACCKLVWV